MSKYSINLLKHSRIYNNIADCIKACNNAGVSIESAVITTPSKGEISIYSGSFQYKGKYYADILELEAVLSNK